nr:hypothetical protein [Buttiauxella gaviniae]
MKWSFQKVTAMIVGLAIFLLGGWSLKPGAEICWSASTSIRKTLPA